MLVNHIKGFICGQEWKQIFAILTAALVSLNTALLYAWPSPSIPILLSSEFPTNVTMEEASYTTVIPSIASIFSSPLYPFLMDKFGRKITLLSVALPQVLSWILISKANDIYTIYLSRLLSGFSNSCLYATLPVYIGEISSPKVRGLWGNAMSCCAYFGLCLMNIVGSMNSLRSTANIFLAIPVIFFLLFMAMPETPYYHLMNGAEEKAYTALKSLRRNQDTIEKEFVEMKEGVAEQMDANNRFVDLVRVKSNRQALIIAITVRGIQQFAGISAFAVYAPYLFARVDGGITASTSAIIYTAALTFCSCTGSILLDFLGRRRAMIISCVGCAVVLLLEAAYFYFIPELSRLYQIRMPYFPILGMLIYVLVYSFGLGIIPNLLLGELFPSNIKGKALCAILRVWDLCTNVTFWNMLHWQYHFLGVLRA
ncbi:facilitated trehalose transporter Tret1-2 homolog isoform X2 [Atheta coriaria]|uniref:facilitated trehalose transporter Tret1-2 homolog isoform X2 n=1 Tax=Dalotia coriaria TaxID=877792 RepID=UPI0031F40EB8